jgi:hypothetical protein
LARGRPEHVYGATVDRATLEPWVRLAALHGNAPKVKRWVQHLNDGFNVKHLAGEALGLLFILLDLAA